MTNKLSFNNPSTDLDFSFEEVTSELDGGSPLTLEDPIEDPEDSEKVKDKPEKPDKSEETDKEGLEAFEGLDIDPKDSDISLEEEEEKEEGKDQTSVSNQYLNLINKLAELDIATELPEDIDKDKDPDEETLLKFIEHNFKLKADTVVEEFYETLSPLAQRVVQFDLNADPELLQPYLRTLSEELDIKKLDPTNEYDQETIVRSWYKQDEWTQEEIEEKIKELKDSATLSKEATRLKPKLDLKAEAIAKEQERAQGLLKQIENKRKSDYYQKVESQIAKGEVAGIKLSKEVARDLMVTLIEDDIPVKLPEGKQIKMPLLEALIFHHKYHPEGDVETLALAALLLRDRKRFDKEYAKVAETELTNKFVRDQKYSSAIKVSGNQKEAIKKNPEKNIAWNSKFK